MQTRVSSKGQVVLPSPVRRKLGLAPGDPLDVNIESGRIVLTPRRTRSHRPKIVIDPITGLPALSAGPDAPLLTSAQVEEMLSGFP
jgi:AbrB family looped-hinge helix DNA binding protein